MPAATKQAMQPAGVKTGQEITHPKTEKIPNPIAPKMHHSHPFQNLFDYQQLPNMC